MCSARSRLTSFSTSSSRALRARKRAATRGRAVVRPPLPLQAAALGLARTCQWVPPGDNETRHQRTTPWVLMAGYRARGSCGLPTGRGPGAPHRPASNHGKCGPARHASRANRSAGEQAHWWTLLGSVSVVGRRCTPQVPSGHRPASWTLFDVLGRVLRDPAVTRARGPSTGLSATERRTVSEPAAVRWHRHEGAPNWN
jgi:hypothetical protein